MSSSIRGSKTISIVALFLLVLGTSWCEGSAHDRPRHIVHDIGKSMGWWRLSHSPTDDLPPNVKRQEHVHHHLRAGASVASSSSLQGLSYYARVALAGGLAGATGTTVLYPMDTAKTLRQSNPTQFASVRSALMHLIRASGAYRGCLPAALGAIPSSALYFGAYEASKQTLERNFRVQDNQKKKWWIHGLAAAAGNTISSTVFVPKEVFKQQLQYHSSASFQQVLWDIWQTKGIRGLYVGYQATLMRNIPSAMIRFVLYEELKQWWSTENPSHPTFQNINIPQPVALFAAGAVAGAVASGIMTPIDVIKTRLATGTCPLGVKNCVRHIMAEMGWRGLYAGAGSRMMWSGAFSAIGFGTFELVKTALGVSNTPTQLTTTTRTTTVPVPKRQIQLT